MKLRKTMIQVEEDVWDYIRKTKWMGETHNDFLRRMTDFYRNNTRECGMCKQIFEENDIDMVNGTWLCRDCDETRE